MVFHTHTHINFGDFSVCVCVLLPDIQVGSVGGDHSWIDLSSRQRPSLNTHQLSIPKVFSPNGTGMYWNIFSEDLHE